jgi:hypothetical protein
LAAGSGVLGQDSDACPFDRDPDIYGIRALKSCRARQYPLRRRLNALGQGERNVIGESTEIIHDALALRLPIDRVT